MKNNYLKAEKALFPEAWEIKRHYWNIDCEEPKEGEKKYLSHITTQIVDNEMDLINITINDGHMEINTKDYTYIHFSERQLKFLRHEYLNAQNELSKSFMEMMGDEKKIDPENEG